MWENNILVYSGSCLESYIGRLSTKIESPNVERLLSLAYHQLQRRQWHWVPWKYRLTVAKSDELAHQRQAKMPKLELA